MASLFAYWTSRSFAPDENSDTPGDNEREDVHQGVLTTDHDDSFDGIPVLVEEETGRVYQPGDLPATATIFLELAPEEMPELVEKAREAGYRLARA